MAQTLLNLGTYPCDTTGTNGRLGFIAINAMFAELFALAALSAPLVINVGTYQAGQNPSVVTVFPTIPLVVGDTYLTAFTKINANFATIFASGPVGQPNTQEVISLGGEVGMIVGQDSPVIGTGDPGRVAGAKINNNFTYLYSVL
jgi:hypothetical protein